MKDQVVERATTAVAAGAMSGPLWLPYLERYLSIGMTILGVVWLLIQIVYKIKGDK